MSGVFDGRETSGKRTHRVRSEAAFAGQLGGKSEPKSPSTRLAKASPSRLLRYVTCLFPSKWKVLLKLIKLVSLIGLIGLVGLVGLIGLISLVGLVKLIGLLGRNNTYCFLMTCSPSTASKSCTLCKSCKSCKPCKSSKSCKTLQIQQKIRKWHFNRDNGHTNI